jgi:hypothetical protein
VPESPSSGIDTYKIQRRLRYAKCLQRKNAMQRYRLGLQAVTNASIGVLQSEDASARISASILDREATLAHRRGTGMECGPSMVKGSPSATRGMTSRIDPSAHGAVCPQCSKWIAVSAKAYRQGLAVYCDCGYGAIADIAQKRYESKALERNELLPHRLDGPIQSREWRTHAWDRQAGKYVSPRKRK